MNNSVAFFKEPRDIGEVVYNGARYRVVYDPRHRRATCVLILEEEQIVGSAIAVNDGHVPVGTRDRE